MMKRHILYLNLSLLALLIVFSVVACNNGIPSDTPDIRVETTTNTDNIANQTPAPTDSAPAATAAYPAAATASPYSPGYPVPTTVPEGISDTPPDPDRVFPETANDRGTVGGVLVREITDQGYLPVTPVELALGNYLENNDGEPSFIRLNDASPRAQLLNTGVFMFTNLEPGTYALIINLGFTQFVIQNEAGYDLVVNVEAGKALDLGQVFVNIPEN
jgi:hypothetical protein